MIVRFHSFGRCLDLNDLTCSNLESLKARQKPPMKSLKADGQGDGFHRLGMSHVNFGPDMSFGPVKKPINGFLVPLLKDYRNAFHLSRSDSKT